MMLPEMRESTADATTPPLFYRRIFRGLRNSMAGRELWSITRSSVDPKFDMLRSGAVVRIAKGRISGNDGFACRLG
jgi:hypothetical protein